MSLASVGADDETRTRDPHLGKVMRYQLRHVRLQPQQGPGLRPDHSWCPRNLSELPHGDKLRRHGVVTRLGHWGRLVNGPR